MPTPSCDAIQPSQSVTISNRATCPPSDLRPRSWRTQRHRSDESVESVDNVSDVASRSPSLEADETSTPATSLGDGDHMQAVKERVRRNTQVEDQSTPFSLPTASDHRQQESYFDHASPTMDPILESSHDSSTNFELSSLRLLPTYTSSFLRPGSRFVGTQQSDKQIYNVEVDIKHVDMAESSLCGYLRIEGLTKDHPTLTTYFDGEIVGPKYSFQTKHESWGSNEKTDMQHWDRFPAWRPLAKQAKKPDFHYVDCLRRENVFMRWKERFLVPNHRVTDINGASFDGFYYICFNQAVGTVSGIYFHSKSEKYQQLELKHVPDSACLGSVEFR